MQDFDDQDIAAEANLLEKSIQRMVDQLNEYRRENELLRAELVSMQDILRSCKLPGTATVAAVDTGSCFANVFAPAEKVQLRQKLVLMLQKIEMELRNSQTL